MIQTKLIHNWLDHWCIWLTPDLIHAMQWMYLVIPWVSWDRLTRQQQNMYWDIYEAQLVWPEICLQCRLEFAGICIMDRKYSGSEEHIQLLFYCEVFHGFLVQHEAKICGLEYHRRRVYNIECAKQCGFKKFWMTYSIMRWILLLFIVITRAVWSSPRTLCFMTDRNTSR